MPVPQNPARFTRPKYRSKSCHINLSICQKANCHTHTNPSTIDSRCGILDWWFISRFDIYTCWTSKDTLGLFKTSWLDSKGKNKKYLLLTFQEVVLIMTKRLSKVESFIEHIYIEVGKLKLSIGMAMSLTSFDRLFCLPDSWNKGNRCIRWSMNLNNNRKTSVLMVQQNNCFVDDGKLDRNHHHHLILVSVFKTDRYWLWK